jgi:hypothetical protein
MGEKDAKRIHSFLFQKFGYERLRTGIVAADVVRVARPESSPIHRDFEWDDTRAAELYREEQARRIIRYIHVESATGEPTRAFHHVEVTEANGETRSAYVAAPVVWSNPDLASQVVEKALAELRLWKARYEQYSELAHVVARIDEILEAEV